MSGAPFFLLAQGRSVVTAPVATALAIVAGPTSIISGSVMAPAFVIEVRDQFGAAIAGTVTITAAVTAGLGTVTAGSIVSISSATRATFATLICTTGTNGNNTFTFTSPGLTSVVSSAIPTTIPGANVPPVTGPVPGNGRKRRIGTHRAGL